jgi:glutamate 5-kinase
VRANWLAALAADIVALKALGKEVVVVTSGAVGLGRHVLGYGARTLELEEKQAAAACGQTPLFAEWAKALSPVAPAQILLTADDSTSRRRYLNARNTLDTLLANANVVPIINENDTVATQELRFGDNDRLSARVAQMAGADLLILFSDIDGLYSKDPRQHTDAEFIQEVREIDASIEAMAGGAGSAVGTGGMATKIQAAKIATSAGCDMLIARGDMLHPLKALQDGGKHTRFIAQGNPMSARKSWIAGDMHMAGAVLVDDGAVKALAGGKSLLPAGVKGVEGSFERGDTVAIKTLAGVLVGKGLIAYDSEDAAKIIGKQSSEIEAILGFKGRDVLIHRDDLVLS